MLEEPERIVQRASNDTRHWPHRQKRSRTATIKWCFRPSVYSPTQFSSCGTSRCSWRTCSRPSRGHKRVDRYTGDCSPRPLCWRSQKGSSGEPDDTRHWPHWHKRSRTATIKWCFRPSVYSPTQFGTSRCSWRTCSRPSRGHKRVGRYTGDCYETNLLEEPERIVWRAWWYSALTS